MHLADSNATENLHEHTSYAIQLINCAQDFKMGFAFTAKDVDSSCAIKNFETYNP